MLSSGDGVILATQLLQPKKMEKTGSEMTLTFSTTFETELL